MVPSPRCGAAGPLLPLLVLALALGARDQAANATQGASSCYYKSHFIVASGAACAAACKAILASKGGVGSIWPELYFKGEGEGGKGREEWGAGRPRTGACRHAAPPTVRRGAAVRPSPHRAQTAPSAASASTATPP